MNILNFGLGYLRYELMRFLYQQLVEHRYRS